MSFIFVLDWFLGGLSCCRLPCTFLVRASHLIPWNRPRRFQRTRDSSPWATPEWLITFLAHRRLIQLLLFINLSLREVQLWLHTFHKLRHVKFGICIQIEPSENGYEQAIIREYSVGNQEPFEVLRVNVVVVDVIHSFKECFQVEVIPWRQFLFESLSFSGHMSLFLNQLGQ